MADERDTAPVHADEAPPLPATWGSHDPDHAWCPAALHRALGEPFIVQMSQEPFVRTQAHEAWQVLGACVRGRSHAHRGEFRDDALATHTDGGLLLLAVADGAGSSTLSRIGAAVTAEMVVARTAQRFRDSDASAPDASRLGTAMAYSVHDAALRLHELAGMAEVSPAAMRTTLILVAVLGDLMLVSQVGDGAVLLQKRDGSVQRVGDQRQDGYAGEVTCFVPDACAMTQAAALRQVDAASVQLVALMTDGIDDPFHPLEQSGSALVQQWSAGTTTPIGGAKQRAVGPVLAGADSLLTWMRFEQRGEVDDRTLLLAWRRNDGA